MLTNRIVNIMIFVCLLSTCTCAALMAQSYNEQWSQAAAMSEPEDAQHLLHQLINDAKNDGNRDTLAQANLELAQHFFYNAISFDSAIYYCDRAISTVQESADQHAMLHLEAWYLKGYFYRKWDKYNLSKEALTIVLNAEENPYTFQATYQMGKLYKDVGEFAMAFKYYHEALELAGDDLKKRIQVYEYIAFAYSIMETPEGARQAIYYLDKLKQAVIELGDWQDYLALVAFNQGDCYYYLGERDKAIELIEEAERLVIADGADRDFLGLIAEFRGHIAFENEEYQKALTYYKKGLEDFIFSFDLGRGEGAAGTYEDIAETYLALGDLDSALYYTNLTIADRTFGVERNVEDIRYPALKDIKACGEKSYLCEDLMFKALIFDQMNPRQQDSTLRYYELAEQLLTDMSKHYIEDETKLFWRERAKDVYQGLIKTYIENGDYQKAFHFIEKSKYVVLQEHMRKKDFAALTSTNADILAYQRILDTIAQLEIDIKNIQLNSVFFDLDNDALLDWRTKEDQALSRLREKYPSAFQNLLDWTGVPVDEIQSHVGDEQAIFINYFIHDSMSYAVYVSNDDIVSREIGPRANITAKVLDFLEYHTPKQSSLNSVEYDTVAYDLFTTLIDKSLVSGFDQLIISVDDVLGLIPFEALTMSISGPSGTFADLDYVISDYAIRYVLNANGLFELPSDHMTDKVRSFVPNFEGETVASIEGFRSVGGQALHGAGAEQRILSDYFTTEKYNNGVTERLFFEKTATPQRILHIASHAEMNDSLPLYSRLFFEHSDDSAYDDVVHVFELKNKTIDADLVVLSACETGVGKIFHGEGILSLGTAFRYAGCSNMVTSLWKIPDQASGTIMSEFYKKMANQLPKFRALRQAKLAYINEATSEVNLPYYWSGLLYYGDAAALSIAPKKQLANYLGWLCAAVLLAIVLYFLIRRILGVKLT